MKDSTYYWATARAKKYNRTLMSREEFDILWSRAGGKCEMTGITFTPRPDGSEDRIWPWRSSLDRIDNSKGYEFTNCRLICVAMNMALHQFGEEVFKVLARCYAESRWDTPKGQIRHGGLLS